MAKRGPPPNDQETESLQLTMPVSLCRYLRWLARHSMLGATPRDVAINILTRELNAMFESGYHDKRHPED